MLLELQARGHRRAEDLARTFEVSKRTVYRDMLALAEAGVPVVSAPGRGYSLMEGYFLPPLSFTPDEATLLLLGVDAVAGSFDAGYADAARAAGRKIEGVLEGEVRREVLYLRETLRLIPAPEHPGVAERLKRLRQAVLERRTVRFTYASRTGETARTADPHALFQLYGVWMTSAYCHTREAMRTFRLDRIEGLELTPTRFTRQPSFQLERDEASERRHLTVRALFAPDAVRWVRERPSFFAACDEETPAGLHVTFRVRTLDDILPYLLSWGAGVRVLEPDDLKERLKAEAARVQALY